MAMKKTIITVVGARPNFMKAAPLLRELKNHQHLNSLLVHTGQHYDKNMSDVFFENHDIQKPDYMLKIGSGSHSFQTGKIMEKFEEVCLKVKPQLVIVLGDINSTLACSIVAKKLHIKLAHIEAGLRSFDREMPEEINRLVTDSISDIFFVTENSGLKNLINEGHNKNNIHLVGNLMIDSLHYGVKKLNSIKNTSADDYGLVTLHRPSNVDNIEQLQNILDDLSKVSTHIKLYFSVHPRTKKQLQKHKIVLDNNIKIYDSLSYLDFLKLMKNSKVIFTDSGGIQEESTVLKIPCYTLRHNTERPITILQGTNILTKPEKGNIYATFKKNKFKINKNYKLPNGWDGKASKRIINKLIEKGII